MATALKALPLLTPKAPNLPIAPVEYTQLFLDQFSNVLRLYFNQLDNYTQALNSQNGGGYLKFPYGAFQNTASQYTTNNTPTIVIYDQTDFANSMYYTAGDGVHISIPGLYNYQFSIQFANTDNASHTAYVWLRVNGTDVPGTGSKFDLPARKSASIDSYIIAACNFFVDLKTNDHIELVWAVDQAATLLGALGIYIEAYTNSTSPFIRPSIPGAVGTLSFVSAV